MNFKNQNKKMVNDLKNQGIHDEKVLNAILKSPRHLFIPKAYHKMAYDDIPIPIGFNATISQPYTVAFMLQALEVQEGNKVLEIGTGSGWNASLLSILVGEKGKVITTEIVPELADFARQNLKDYNNIEVINTDGSKGYEEQAPYNRIIFTCAIPKIHNHFIEQLKDPGILVAPVGDTISQDLIKLTKKHLQIKRQNLGSFIFVPLKGKYGF